MAIDDIRATVVRLRRYQQAIQAACATQSEGWRRKVVDERRNIATSMGTLSTLFISLPAAEGTDALRRAVSDLRAALAEHQALWPAIAIDTLAPAYSVSVSKVRACYQNIEAVLARMPPHMQHDRHGGDRSA